MLPLWCHSHQNGTGIVGQFPPPPASCTPDWAVASLGNCLEHAQCYYTPLSDQTGGGGGASSLPYQPSFSQESLSHKVDTWKIFPLEGTCFSQGKLNEYRFTHSFYQESSDSPNRNTTLVWGLGQFTISPFSSAFFVRLVEMHSLSLSAISRFPFQSRLGLRVWNLLTWNIFS